MSDTVSRLNAALQGRYAIERELGQGGMATVYLAKDVKHNRHVALKVLKPELAAVVGAERFLAEIETTANLQHPNILPLFDSGEADSFLFYVMPYVEGESLRDRLDREGQLPVDEAGRIVADIAEALQAAHEQGVIHRDIKPANILLSRGRPLVADFGIALAVSAAGGGRLTETGLSLGTPHYMSPEQATGDQHVGRATDIYALACVHYEMLVGEPPYTGSTPQAVLGKIIAGELASASKQRSSVPGNVDAAIKKALEKVPADRFTDAHEFARALADPGFASTTKGGTPESRVWKRLAIGSLGVAAAMTGLFAWTLLSRQTGPEDPAMRFEFTMGNPLDGPRQAQLAISPDGRRVVQGYTDSSGTPRLLMREFGSTEVRVVPGTEGAWRPFFSPDGAWLGFATSEAMAGGSLQKVPADGGAALEITDSCNSGSWGPNDVIICVSTSTWGLARVSANGGDFEELTLPDTANGEIGHWQPQVLPDGNAVIFTSYRRPTTRIEAYDLDTGSRTVLVEPAVFARYSPTGHLLYVDGGALFAIRFDAKRLRTEGSAIPLLSDIASIPSAATAGLAVASNGTLVAVKASDWSRESEVIWVDRNGTERPTFSDVGRYSDLRLAPDERRFVVTNTTRGERQIWMYDFDRQALSQLTRAGQSALEPIWAPDGQSVIFTNETPAYDLFRIPLDGSTQALPIVQSTHDKYPRSVSPDGATVAFTDRWDQHVRIMFAPLDGRSAVEPFADSSMSTVTDPAFSPDGRWLTYVGGADLRLEVYVRAVDGSGGRMQVSVEGGRDPRWTRGGREIMYRKGNAFMAVSVDPARGESGSPVELFRGRYGDYDATADGDRSLVLKPIERPAALPILVWFNWEEELKRLGSN